MKEYTIYGVKINIALEHGVWKLSDESAIGKSYLCSLLKDLRRTGIPVFGYTYNDIVDGIDLASNLVKDKYEVILLDRYDLYQDLCRPEIFSCAKNSIILVDYKQDRDFPYIDYCFIDRPSETCIEVSR